MDEPAQPVAYGRPLDVLFRVTSAFTIAGWLTLILAPDFVVANRWAVAMYIAPLCIAYVAVLVFGRRYDRGIKTGPVSFFSLRGVMNLFKSPSATLAGWIHYMAFDFVVGVLIVHDAIAVGVNHLLVVPCLLLTLMLGPAGLLTYGAVRFLIS